MSETEREMIDPLPRKINQALEGEQEAQWGPLISETDFPEKI